MEYETAHQLGRVFDILLSICLLPNQPLTFFFYSSVSFLDLGQHLLGFQFLASHKVADLDDGQLATRYSQMFRSSGGKMETVCAVGTDVP